MFKTLPRPLRVALGLTAIVGSGVELVKAQRELKETDWSQESAQALTEKKAEVAAKGLQTVLLVGSLAYQFKK